MPLTREQIYNDLNGDDVKQILVERFVALLDQVPYLRSNITLPRVKMTMMVTLDIQDSPPQTITDQLTMRTEDAEPVDSPFPPSARRADMQATVDARDNPPDMVREEHGIPVPGLIHVPGFGHQDVESSGVAQDLKARQISAPVVGPVMKDGRTWGAHVTLDRGAPAQVVGIDAGYKDLAQVPQPKAKPEVGLQADFLDAQRALNEERKGKK